ALRDAGVLLPARDVRCADNDDVGGFQIFRCHGMRLAHEGRHVGVDEREVAGADEGAVADHVPRRIAHACLPGLEPRTGTIARARAATALDAPRARPLLSLPTGSTDTDAISNQRCGGDFMDRRSFLHVVGAFVGASALTDTVLE